MTGNLPYAKNYQDLLAYKMAAELADKIYRLTLIFPKDEIYSLTNQVRRSSRSVGAQIAEAWGKRFYIKHFISKLTDATAELNETEHWIEMAFRSQYIDQKTKDELLSDCLRTKSLIHGMINKASLFCRNP